MFRRAFKSYRRARRYVKHRASRSFLQTGMRSRVASRVRHAMDPPSEKKRKMAQVSQNMDDEDMKEAGLNPAQAGGAAITKLSSVRFKNEASEFFEYHHFVRRFQPTNSPLVISGVTGATGSYACQSIANGLIADWNALSAVFARCRITRVRWEFIPQFTNSVAGAAAPTSFPLVVKWQCDNAEGAKNLPTTFGEAMDDPNGGSIIKGNQYFSVDSIPVCVHNMNIDVNGGTATSYTDASGLWFNTGVAIPQMYQGIIWWKIPQGNPAAYVSQVYDVVITTWFDMDQIV